MVVFGRSLDPIAETRRSMTIKKTFQEHTNFLEAIFLVIQSTFVKNIRIYNKQTWTPWSRICVKKIVSDGKTENEDDFKVEAVAIQLEGKAATCLDFLAMVGDFKEKVRACHYVETWVCQRGVLQKCFRKMFVQCYCRCGGFNKQVFFFLFQNLVSKCDDKL
jgi:hypothetical protein